jgi:hypothetical protein
MALRKPKGGDDLEVGSRAHEAFSALLAASPFDISVWYVGRYIQACSYTIRLPSDGDGIALWWRNWMYLYRIWQAASGYGMPLLP